jgi:thiamine kinase-like enzyme
MIKSESGLMLIDWEYACGMDPAFDLAAVCASSKLSEAQRSQLLQGYGVGKIDTDFLKRLRYYQYYYQLIEILWWRRRGKKNAEQLGALAREILKR